jgi:hypothetical protein
MDLRQVQETYAQIYQGMMLTLRDVKYVPETAALIDELKELKDRCPEILSRQCDGGCLKSEDNQVFIRIHEVVSGIISLTNKDASLIEEKPNGINYCLEAIKLMGYDIPSTKIWTA